MCERAAMVEHQILPLTHVAKIVVVQEYDLHRSLLLHDRSKFLYTHLETTITGEQTNLTVRCAKGCANSGGQSKAHCTQATTRNDTAMTMEFEITTREHLVQTDIIDKYGLAFGSLSNGIHHFTHQQFLALRMNRRFDNLCLLFLIERLEGVTPLTVNSFLQVFGDSRKTYLTVTHHGYIRLHILVDL